jgi:hypothetical protein
MPEYGHPALRPTRYHWAAGTHVLHWLPAMGGWVATLGLGVAALGTANPTYYYTAASVTALASIGWSGIWLLIVPNISTFKRMVDSRLGARFADSFPFHLNQIEERLSASPVLVSSLRGITQLRNRAREIMLRRFGKDDPFAQDNLVKFDRLAIAYLQLLTTLTDYDDYLQLVDPHHLEADLTVARENAAEANEDTRAIRERQVLLLENRLKRYQKVKEKIGLLREEAGSIETTMKLLVDQAMTTPDSGAVWADIDTVLDNIKDSEILSQDMKVFDDLERSLQAQRTRLHTK